MPDYYIPWSEREGLSEVRTQIQDSGMDKDLRVDLWNTLWEHVLDVPLPFDVLRDLWRDILRRPIHEFKPDKINFNIELLFLVDGDWRLLCSILQFFTETLPDHAVGRFISSANSAFHRGKFAWHFMDRILVRYISEAETKAVQIALQDSQPFPEVSKQLETALREFSARENPHYGHAAKEAISALETLVRQLVGDPNITLGDGLKVIRQSKKPEIHGALINAFENLWGYASDKGFLRHGGKPGDSTEVTLEEAQLVLVTCAAIISFLIARALAEGMV